MRTWDRSATGTGAAVAANNGRTGRLAPLPPLPCSIFAICLTPSGPAAENSRLKKRKSCPYCRPTGLPHRFGPTISRLGCAHRLAVRTPPFHGGNRGSIPLGRTNFNMPAIFANSRSNAGRTRVRTIANRVLDSREIRLHVGHAPVCIPECAACFSSPDPVSAGTCRRHSRRHRE